MSDVSKIILGSLLMKPAMLEITDLSEADFLVDRERKVFRLIADIWNDTAPALIDPVLLAERLGGDEPATFVGSLTKGLQHDSPEIFVGRVSELRESIVVRRLTGRLKKETDLESKTGTRMDLTGILRDIDEIRRLRQPKDVALVGLDKIEPKAISWLWPGRIPKAMLTLLVGDPGAGKSFCSISLAARLSQGIPLPDSPNSTGCSSLFIVGEDPVAEAIRPRADANGADCSKIFILQEPEFCLTEIEILRWILERHKDVGLIVIDPLTAFLPAKTRWIEDPSIRAALLPLVDFAEETGAAVLAIAHFRKAETNEIIHKVAGSIGLAGIARSILAVTRDENDRERRLLLPIKSSYSRKPLGLAFRITGEDMGARIVFEDKPIEADAEDVLSSSEKKEAAAECGFNERWLLSFLKDGPKTFQEIEEESPGISRRTLFRLADKLEQNGKLERAPGTTGRFKIWRLPA